MSEMEDVDVRDGLRERKRRETLQRIAECGLKLFSEGGYDATTVDAIAASAGISPRTFFYYFRSKDEVLQHWHEWSGGTFLASMKASLASVSDTETPRAAARECLIRMEAQYETEQSIVVDALMHSTETLRMRMQAIYAALEKELLVALSERWPQIASREPLRVIAMITIGVMRLAMEEWRNEAGERPLRYHLQKTFDLFEHALTFHDLPR